jgi:putative effector of murein hydrolase LrgA (UPF0299 family)
MLRCSKVKVIFRFNDAKYENSMSLNFVPMHVAAISEFMILRTHSIKRLVFLVISDYAFQEEIWQES